MRYVTFILLIVIQFGNPNISKSQQTDAIQVSGVVLRQDSLKALPYTTILIRHSQKGTISDNSGYFSLFISAGDTLQFSNVGYKTAQFVLPSSLNVAHYSLIQLMQRDTITLKQVTITPWPELDDLMKAFLDPSKDDGQDQRTGQMQKRMQSLLNRQQELDNAYYDQMRYSKLYQTTGIVPPNNFLNPFTWSNFIRDWRKGTFKNKRGYLPRPIEKETKENPRP